jgi:hypothetical protein
LIPLREVYCSSLGCPGPYLDADFSLHDRLARLIGQVLEFARRNGVAAASMHIEHPALA